MDSDEWGEGGGVGTYERGGSAARPSSSVCALVVRVHAHCPVHGRSLCVGGASLLSVGGVVGCGPWVIFLFVGHGRRWWVWGVVHGHCVVVMGTGLLFVGTGLLIVVGGARSHGRVVRVCWFVVCGCGGNVSSALWSSLATLEGTRVGVLTMDVSINNDEQRHHRRLSCGCRGLRGHQLASTDGREGVTHHKEQQHHCCSSFGCHVGCL